MTEEQKKQRQMVIDVLCDAAMEYILTGKGFVIKPDPLVVKIKEPKKKKTA